MCEAHAQPIVERRAVGLNDLLCTPLILTLVLPVFCVLTLIAPNLKNITSRFAHCQLLFETNKIWSLKPKRIDHYLKQTNWNYDQFYLHQKPPTEITTKNNNPIKLPTQWITHKTDYSRYLESANLGFHVLTFGFCITLELSRRA